MRGLEICSGSPENVMVIFGGRGYRTIFEDQSRTSLVRSVDGTKPFPRLHSTLERGSGKGDNNNSPLFLDLHIDISQHSSQGAGKILRRELNVIVTELRSSGEEIRQIPRERTRHGDWGDKRRALQKKLIRQRKQEKYPDLLFPEEGVIFLSQDPDPFLELG